MFEDNRERDLLARIADLERAGLEGEATELRAELNAVRMRNAARSYSGYREGLQAAAARWRAEQAQANEALRRVLRTDEAQSGERARSRGSVYVGVYVESDARGGEPAVEY